MLVMGTCSADSVSACRHSTGGFHYLEETLITFGKGDGRKLLRALDPDGQMAPPTSRSQSAGQKPLSRSGRTTPL